MLNSKSFLAVDFGASNLKLAEFEVNEDGGLLLKQYSFKSLGQEGTQESTRQAALLRSLQEMIAENPSKARNVSVCAPGYHTFSKFVKLPPVDTSKVTQIIQYEAQQNVPFPLDEVVWDYQILGAAPTGELEVLLVAIKSDIVESISRVADSSGLRLQLVEVSPAALCNAFRYNYPDLEGCSMLLDIGAKTSNLLFFEKGNVYSRSIAIGANSITQDFSKEARLPFTEAERIKIEEGFVSLGGAYEEPENQQQAAISKIARQVMTRLHIQVNQTIQFYRTQQGGSAPVRLFLSGGASIMPYMAQFFSEKLNLAAEDVQYFNPLRSVQIAPELNREELAKVAHSLGEVVGLGLRNLAHCPVELNLMPKSYLKRQELNQKKPYFAAVALCLVLIFFASGWFYSKVAQQKGVALEQLNAKLGPLTRNDQRLTADLAQLKGVETEAQQYMAWVQERYYWGNLMSDLREILRKVETDQEKALGDKTGIWIEKLTPLVSGRPAGGAWQVESNVVASATPEGAPPGPREMGGGPPPRGPGGPMERGRGRGPGRMGWGGGGGLGPAPIGSVTSVALHFRGVNMTKAGAAANTGIAYAVQKEFESKTNLFDPSGITAGTIALDPSELTFSFGMTVRLKRPIKL